MVYPDTLYPAVIFPDRGSSISQSSRAGATASPKAERLFQAAAQPTLQRIRTDRLRVSRRIKPLLAYIEDHLFEAGLDVNELKRRCGVRDNSLSTAFHAEVGLAPYAYIEDCRTEVARRLLAGTEIKVWLIARYLGYSSIHVFSRAFKRVAGCCPTDFRRGAEGMDEEAHLSESSRAATCFEGWALRPEDIGPLVRRIVDLYPESRETIVRAATERERSLSTVTAAGGLDGGGAVRSSFAGMVMTPA